MNTIKKPIATGDQAKQQGVRHKERNLTQRAGLLKHPCQPVAVNRNSPHTTLKEHFSIGRCNISQNRQLSLPDWQLKREAV